METFREKIFPFFPERLLSGLESEPMGLCIYDFQCLFGQDNAGSDCKHCPYYENDENEVIEGDDGRMETD